MRSWSPLIVPFPGKLWPARRRVTCESWAQNKPGGLTPGGHRKNGGPDPPCNMASMRTLRLSAALALVAAGLFAAQPTVQEAKKFLDDAEKKLLALGNEAGQASW